MPFHIPLQQHGVIRWFSGHLLKCSVWACANYERLNYESIDYAQQCGEIHKIDLVGELLYNG